MMRAIKYLKKYQIKIALANCLRALAKLQRAYFACYLQPNYLVKQTDYEKEMQKRRLILLQCMSKAKQLLHSENVSEEMVSYFYKINRLSEIIFSLNLLRFRVQDRAIFELCQDEMQVLADKFIRALENLAENIIKDRVITGSTELQEAIDCFEAISNRTLQVVSREPLVFSFFIQDLYALQGELNEKMD